MFQIPSMKRAAWAVVAAFLSLHCESARKPEPTVQSEPIPADPAIPAEKGYVVQPLGEGLYWFAGPFQQSFFMTTGQGVIVVDAPPSLMPQYLAAIAETTSEPITHAIYSHAHTDHIGGADKLPSSVIRIAQEETHAILARDQDPRRPLPTVTFKDHYTLQVGNQVLQLDYRGPNHLKGNIFIYAPKQKVLALMDYIFTDHSPFPHLAYAEDLPNFIRHFDYALEYDFKYFVSGHVRRLAVRSDLELNKAYYEDLRDSADRALQAVNIMDIAQQLGEAGAKDSMLFIKTYLDAVADETVRQMLPRWKDRLYGVEATLRDNAERMIHSRRID